MFRLASVSSASALGNFPAIKLDSFKEGLLCAALVLRIAYPGAVASAGMTSNLATEGHISTILDSMIGTLTLGYGDNAKRKVYVGVTGSELRHVHRAALARDTFNNWDLTTTGNKTITVDVVIPFCIPGLKDGMLRLPGTTQMRSMELNIQEGASISISAGGTLTRQSGANVTIDVDPLTLPSPDKRDQWSSILSYYKHNSSELKARTPQGVHAFAWLANSAYASTAVTFFSLSATASGVVQELAESVPPYIAQDHYLFHWSRANPAWGIGGSTTNGILIESEISESVTMLFSPFMWTHSAKLPAGVITFTGPSQYYTTYNLRGLYWPEIEPDEALEASRMCSKTAAVGVNMTQPEGSTLAEYPNTHVATMPLIALRASETGYTLKPGVITAAPGQNAHVSIPPHVRTAVQGAATLAAQSGGATGAAAQREAATQLSRAIPGLATATAAAAVSGTITPLADRARTMAPAGQPVEAFDEILKKSAVAA